MTEKRFKKDDFEEEMISMTKKRYIARNWGIIETKFNDEPRRNYIWEHFKTIQSIADLLNKLHIQNCEQKSKIDFLIKKNNKLNNENKELKYHLNRTEKELKEYKEFMSLG